MLWIPNAAVNYTSFFVRRTNPGKIQRWAFRNGFANREFDRIHASAAVAKRFFSSRLKYGDGWLRCSAPTCYGSSLGSNPDISQKYKMRDISKGVGNTF